MRSRIARLVALAVCLAAPLGWVMQAQAETDTTVDLTGNVVGEVISLTLTLGDNSNANTIAFGNIDQRGAQYNETTSPAVPFFVAAGTAWFLRQPIVVTVTTSVPLGLYSCFSEQSRVVDTRGSRLFFSRFGMPPNDSEADRYVNFDSVPLCTSSVLMLRIFDASLRTSSFTPIYLIRNDDGIGSFSGTILFVVTPL